MSENDTLKVRYSFADYNGKVGIALYNKSGGPLEIDWKKSALIVDGRAYSYYNPNAAVVAGVEADSLRRQQTFARPGQPLYLASVNGSVLIDEPSQFIPPASFIYKEPLALPVNGIDKLPEKGLKKRVHQIGTVFRRSDFLQKSAVCQRQLTGTFPQLLDAAYRQRRFAKRVYA